jgi:elongation factor G
VLTWPVEGLSERDIARGWQGVRVVLTDGVTHPVDSSDMAFRQAAAYAVREGIRAANACVLEPIMKLEVMAPGEFQGNIMGQLNRRMAVVQSNDVGDDGVSVTIKADAPLAQMFGYSTDLRSITQGKGEFTMEYKCHNPVTKDAQEELIKKYKASLSEGSK